MKIRRGDTVKIIAGNDKGKDGKVLEVFPREGRILIEGVSVKKRHVRPRRRGQKGEIVEKPASIPASRVMILCGACNMPARIGVKRDGGVRRRVCKRCGKYL